ncbi:VTT domain-containing protein [Salinicola lusitanus]|uniref:VTT domain-containing protein n=1 Tax=Salinicola lusitanus TaxID=1949085 RepID=UPI000DA18694|nr:VTT domain-containing protein [Salinicola lusitanus]
MTHADSAFPDDARSDVAATRQRSLPRRQRAMKLAWRWWRVALAAGLGVALCVLFAAYGGVPHGWLEELQLLPFTLAMIVLPALGVPMTPFFIVAGLRFGVAGGLAVAALATLCNLLLCYAIAHSRLRPRLRQLLQRRFPALGELDADRRSAWRVTFLIKLVPGVPMFIKHYALGVAGVPRSIYLTVALLTTGPYGVAFVVLGESALSGDLGQALGALAALALIAVSLLAWRQARRRRLARRAVQGE